MFQTHQDPLKASTFASLRFSLAKHDCKGEGTSSDSRGLCVKSIKGWILNNVVASDAKEIVGYIVRAVQFEGDPTVNVLSAGKSY